MLVVGKHRHFVFAKTRKCRERARHNIHIIKCPRMRIEELYAAAIAVVVVIVWCLFLNVCVNILKINVSRQMCDRLQNKCVSATRQ